MNCWNAKTMWKILGEKNKNKRTYLVVECMCGYSGERRKDFVLSGRSSECKTCSTKRTAKKTFKTNSFFNKGHKGLGKISRTKFGTYKFGAQVRGVSFEITIEDAFSIWTGFCALSGIELNESTMSLDRIDSTKGYTKDNIQWVHKEINFMKQELSDVAFIKWCSLVTANQQPSLENAQEVSKKVQRLPGEEATNNLGTSAQHPNKDDDIV